MRPNLQHGVTGKGLNDYDTIFRILSEAGYDGWVSIEDGMNGMDEMRQSIDFLKVMRDKYFSSALPSGTHWNQYRVTHVSGIQDVTCFTRIAAYR